MPELILISVERSEVVAKDHAVRCGDAEALKWFKSLWDQHQDQSLSCFVCDEEIAYPPFAIVLPDYADATQERMIAAPLCNKCQALPKMQRLARCFRILKRMSGRRNLAFHFVGNGRHF
jgi:hypothetical protein